MISVKDMDRMELLKQLELADPKNQLDAQATVFALNSYTNMQIYEAYAYHKTVSPFPMKVCDVVEYWKNKNGESTEALEQRAALIFEKFFKHPNTAWDHVADKRVVYAFRVAFGDLVSYGCRTDYIEGIDKKNFIKAYVNARPEDYELSSNVLPGIYHYKTFAEPKVICIGEHNKQLAREIYGNRVILENYVTYKRPQLEVKEEVPLTPEQKKANLDRVLKIMQDLVVKTRVRQ